MPNFLAARELFWIFRFPTIAASGRINFSALTANTCQAVDIGVFSPYQEGRLNFPKAANQPRTLFAELTVKRIMTNQEYTEQVKFYPWVGKNYGKHSRFGMSVLVLGESHYGEKEELTKDFTQSLTKSYINHEMSHAFWTEIGSMVLNMPHTEFERHDFWEHVAFYNYVQTLAGASARQSPTTTQFEESENAFFEVIEKTQPDLIIGLGKRLWNNASNKGRSGEKISVKNKIANVWYYPYRGREATAVFVNHPASFGFVASAWSPVIQEALKIAKENYEKI